jgi:hypothetical protein
MNQIAAITPEVRSLIEAACDGVANDAQLRDLQSLLRTNENACSFYVDLLNLDAELQWLIGSRQEGDAALTEFTSAKQTLPQQPAFPLLSHSALTYFSSGWPVAYLIATVVLGLGLVIGAATHVSRPEQVVQQNLPSHFGKGAGGEGVERPDSPHPSVVGRITGTVDCRFAADSKPQAPRTKTVVSIGDKFNLVSGLLEITYDTGAKVILQGPVTYTVESPASGFLSVGRLTASVENSKTKDQRPKTEAPHPSSLIPHPLFAVRTPTATVTDLGTEFGVEVTTKGDTVSHVFRGVVEVQPLGHDAKGEAHAVRLTDNESVRVQRSDIGARAVVQRVAIDPAAFVRIDQFPRPERDKRLNSFRRWQTYSMELRRDPSLLAYYDFQLVGEKSAVLPNVTANGDRSRDGVVENATWTTGRMPGKHALLFLGRQDYVSVNLPQKARSLSLAAWICLDPAPDHMSNGILMSSGWLIPGQVHWQLDSLDGHMSFACVSSEGSSPYSSPALLGDRWFRHWRHVACICDRAAGRIRLYLDGRCVADSAYRLTGPVSIGPAWIGNWDHGTHQEYGPRNFRGRIDELAVFGRPLGPDEVQRMYQQGKP